MTREQDEVIRCGRHLDEAQKILSEAVKKAYPLDCRVAVTLGRARVVGRVTLYGMDYCEPEMVYIENEITGKQRKFSATYEDCAPEILS